jgi:N6-L-threonylcarbamoyladenine synthase
VAKLLGLGYPGGPAIDRAAHQGNDRAFDFPAMRITHADRRTPHDPGRLDFSFSGLKTAVLRIVRERQQGGRSLDDQQVADICASFQRVVVETLLDRTFAVARDRGAACVGIAGGVSANSRLRADALRQGHELGLPVFVPSLALSTDNAAMIAAAGLRAYDAGVRASMDLNAEATLPLGPLTP